MRITSRGRVTIPKAVRDQLGFVPGSQVDFQIEGGEVWLVNASDARCFDPEGSPAGKPAAGQGGGGRRDGGE